MHHHPKVNRRSFTATAATLLLALAGGVLPTGAARAQSLTGAGATFPNPIYQKWFAAYAFPVGTGAKGNDGVSSTVKQIPGGIGYVELI